MDRRNKNGVRLVNGRSWRFREIESAVPVRLTGTHPSTRGCLHDDTPEPSYLDSSMYHPQPYRTYYCGRTKGKSIGDARLSSKVRRRNI